MCCCWRMATRGIGIAEGARVNWCAFRSCAEDVVGGSTGPNAWVPLCWPMIWREGFNGNENVAGRVFSGCRNDHIGLQRKTATSPISARFFPCASSSITFRFYRSRFSNMAACMCTVLLPYCCILGSCSVDICWNIYLPARKQE